MLGDTRERVEGVVEQGLTSGEGTIKFINYTSFSFSKFPLALILLHAYSDGKISYVC